MRPDSQSPVVALDIDGTLGAYHEHFTRFCEQWVGRPMPDPQQLTGGVPFHKHLGISKRTYRAVKLAYRQGGLKRSMPVFEGVGDLTRHIRNKGALVWICTTRPYLSLDNIEPDTKHWLRVRAGAQYDNVLFGEHKYRDLVRAVGRDRVVLVADDLPEMIEQAVGLGLPAYLRAAPYNEQYDGNGMAGRVRSIPEIRDAFDIEWKRFSNG